MNIVTPAEMEEIDRATIKDHGLNSLVLMENAARSTISYLPEGKVGVLVGPGNNGGDGLVIARVLAEQGRSVEVLLLTEKRSTDAEANLQLARNWGVLCHHFLEGDEEEKVSRFLADKHLVIDALFGTGLTREREGRWKRLVEIVNGSSASIMAVDIPSGINGTDGQVQGTAVRAHLTVTFGCLKRGHLLMPGRDHCGQVRLTQPGFHPDALRRFDQVQLMNRDLARITLPKVWPTMHKGDNGRLLMLTGSTKYPGAGILSTLGALNAGAGLLSHSWPPELNQTLLQWAPEAMPTPRDTPIDWKNYNAAVVGSGLGPDSQTLGLQALLDCPLPMVVDADALAFVKERDQSKRDNMVLTPHPGELSKLTNRPVKELEENRIDAAIEAARQWNCVVCFKGAPTVTASPNGKVYINGSGNPVLAQGGTGDVLAGVIGSYLAYGLPPLQAAACGAFIHGLSADLALQRVGPRGATAHRIAELVPFAYAEIVGKP